jgi:hypothetical protein
VEFAGADRATDERTSYGDFVNAITVADSPSGIPQPAVRRA